LPEYFALTCKAATPPINESVRRPSILINKRRSSNAASTMAFDSTIGPNADMATLRMQACLHAQAPLYLVLLNTGCAADGDEARRHLDSLQ